MGHGPFTAPPWEQSYNRNLLNGAVDDAPRPPPDGLYNRGINGYDWELWKLHSYGVRHIDVLITETGWTACLWNGDIQTGLNSTRTALVVGRYLFLGLAD